MQVRVAWNSGPGRDIGGKTQSGLLPGEVRVDLHVSHAVADMVQVLAVDAASVGGEPELLAPDHRDERDRASWGTDLRPRQNHALDAVEALVVLPWGG